MAAEGIMTLAQQSAPQGPMPTAPQQMDPAMEQEARNAFFAQDPNEIEQGIDESISADPALAQQLQQILSSMSLTDEVKEALLTVIQAIFENPGEYDEIRRELLAIGFPAELLPETMDLEFFSTLRFALMRAPTTAPVQKFKDGGPVSLKPVAQFLQEQGRNGDTILAHINPQEAAMLKRMGGAGTINPVTGLREYGLKKFIKKAVNIVTAPVKAVAKAVVSVVKPVVNAVKAVVKPVLDATKKLLANPIVRTVATVAAAAFIGPAVGALLPMGVTAAGTLTAIGAAAGTAITTTGVNLLAGDKPKDALKGGLAAGIIGGGIAYAGGAPITPTVQDVALVNPFTGTPVFSQPTAAGSTGPAGGAGSATTTTGGTAPPAGGSAPPPPSAPPPTFGQKVLNTGLDVLKNVGTTVGTGYALQALGGKEPPPTPEDLGIPEVTKTGMDLINENPEKYNWTIGDTTVSYVDPTQPGPSPETPDVAVPSYTPKDVTFGEVTTTEVGPGVVPELPQTASYDIPTPDFGSFGTPATSGFGVQTSTAPTPEQLADPTSPFYNPFAAQLAMMTSSAPAQPEVQAFAKGGIVSVQKFAKGGKVVGRTKDGRPIYGASSPVGGNITAATMSKAQLDSIARQQKAQEQARAAAQSKSVAQAQARALQIKQQQEAVAKAAAAKRQQEAAARAQAERAAAEAAARAEQQRQEAIRRQAEEAARAKAAQEAEAKRQAEAAARAQAEQEAAARAEAERIAREKEQARVNEGVSQYRTMFASGLSPTIEDQAISSALEADRAANPRSYMTSSQIADLDAEEAMKAELARIAEQRRLFDAEQAALAKERERQAKLAEAAAEFERYKSSFTPGLAVNTTPRTDTPIVLGGATTAPSGTQPATSGGTQPATSGGTSSGIAGVMPSSPVYGPDGTEYPSASDAISAGVLNYTTYQPVSVPTFNFGTNTQTNQNNPFLFTGDSTPSAPAIGFAQGGIAAMAPSRFRSGSPASGVMNFPRKVGPINGPGTGTSDSIPAMLSDGEFVFTAKAVRNFGNGSRREGAKKMYQMMKALERKS